MPLKTISKLTTSYGVNVNIHVVMEHDAFIQTSIPVFANEVEELCIAWKDRMLTECDEEQIRGIRYTIHPVPSSKHSVLSVTQV